MKFTRLRNHRRRLKKGKQIQNDNHEQNNVKDMEIYKNTTVCNIHHNRLDVISVSNKIRHPEKFCDIYIIDVGRCGND